MSGNHQKHGDLYHRLKFEHDHHLASPFALSIVIEDTRQGRLLAYFSGTFVNRDTHDLLLDKNTGLYPYPKILERERSGLPVHPTLEELACPSSETLLWFLIAFVNPDIDVDLSIRARSLAARSWLDRFGGFRLSGIYFSLDDRNLQGASELGLLPIFRATDEWGNGTTVAGRTRDQMSGCGNTFMNELFSWTAASVTLTQADKELLYLASYWDCSDLDLANALSVSVDAVRARWKSAALRVRTQPTCLGEKSPWGTLRKELIRFAVENRSSLWPAPIAPSTRAAVERLRR